MGKTSKPLKLWIDPVLGDFEVIQTIIGKGHEVVLAGDADVMIGPKCWRIDPSLKLGDDSTVEGSLERQLDMMLEGVRSIKYPKEKKHEQTKG